MSKQPRRVVQRPRFDWVVGEKGQEWLPIVIADCCGHAEEAHDLIGCLITACQCVRLHGDPERLISVHELSEMFRMYTEDVDNMAREQVVPFDRDENGHPALRAKNLGAFKVVACERGY